MAELSSALDTAIRGSDVEQARALFNRQPELLGQAGWWLYKAARNNDLRMVRMLVEDLGIGVDAPRDGFWYEGHGSAPLCAAAEEGALDVARYLLERGADVNLMR